MKIKEGLSVNEYLKNERRKDYTLLYYQYTKKHELEINLCTCVHITSVERVRTTATMARHFHFDQILRGIFESQDSNTSNT